MGIAGSSVAGAGDVDVVGPGWQTPAGGMIPDEPRNAAPAGTTSPVGIAGATCPSVLDVARFESGDLDTLRGAVINAHARHCIRCATSLAELRQARREILGATDNARLSRSRVAAREIADVLRRRLQ